jgi:hypothetical protein
LLGKRGFGVPQGGDVNGTKMQFRNVIRKQKLQL